jgi:hypothetical protein
LRRAEAQAEAGPLMRMVRRANMGPFHSSRPTLAQSPANPRAHPVADFSKDTNLLITGENS